MAKDLWCRRCEQERDWSDIEQRGLGAESQYCSCGAFAGPGSDDVLLIENMTIEDMAAMAAAKEDAEPEVDTAGVPIYPAGGIVFTPTETPLQIITKGMESRGHQLVAVRNESGGVDIQITIGEAAGVQMLAASEAVKKAMADQFRLRPAASEMPRDEVQIDLTFPHGMIPLEAGPDPLAPYAEAGRALLGSLKPAPDPVKVRIADRVADFDSAFDGAIRHALTIDHAEPEAKPHMRVPTFEEREAERERDRQRIAALWNELKG